MIRRLLRKRDARLEQVARLLEERDQEERRANRAEFDAAAARAELEGLLHTLAEEGIYVTHEHETIDVTEAHEGYRRTIPGRCRWKVLNL